jgi:hypothetical protein
VSLAPSERTLRQLPSAPASPLQPPSAPASPLKPPGTASTSHRRVAPTSPPLPDPLTPPEQGVRGGGGGGDVVEAGPRVRSHVRLDAPRTRLCSPLCHPLSRTRRRCVAERSRERVLRALFTCRHIPPAKKINKPVRGESKVLRLTEIIPGRCVYGERPRVRPASSKYWHRVPRAGLIGQEHRRRPGTMSEFRVRGTI